MIKRLFVITLVAYILLHVSLSGVYANRRQPTQEEYQKFMPIVRDWLTIHWDRRQKLDWGSYRKQEIMDISFCCIDEFEGGKHIHIIDIKFHEQIYEHAILTSEADMIQRVLFKCKDFKIIDFDPTPAYRIEEVG